MENLIKNLKNPLILKFDFDILLKTLNILIRSHVVKDIYEFYEFKCFQVKELTFFSEFLEQISRAEINFINVFKRDKVYFIDIELTNSNLNIKILCKEFELKFLAKSY